MWIIWLIKSCDLMWEKHIWPHHEYVAFVEQTAVLWDPRNVIFFFCDVRCETSWERGICWGEVRAARPTLPGPQHPPWPLDKTSKPNYLLELKENLKPHLPGKKTHLCLDVEKTWLLSNLRIRCCFLWDVHHHCWHIDQYLNIDLKFNEVVHDIANSTSLGIWVCSDVAAFVLAENAQGQ